MQSNAFRRGRGRSDRGASSMSRVRRGGARGTRSIPLERDRRSNSSVSSIVIPSKRSHSLSTASPSDLPRGTTVATVVSPSGNSSDVQRSTEDGPLGGQSLFARDMVR